MLKRGMYMMPEHVEKMIQEYEEARSEGSSFGDARALDIANDIIFTVKETFYK